MESSFGPRTAITRDSAPSVQYATPRVCRVRCDAPSASKTGSPSSQMTAPLVGSSAATVPRPVLTYRRPSAISGVFWAATGAPSVSPFRIASGITDWRQAMASRSTVAALI